MLLCIIHVSGWAKEAHKIVIMWSSVFRDKRSYCTSFLYVAVATISLHESMSSVYSIHTVATTVTKTYVSVWPCEIITISSKTEMVDHHCASHKYNLLYPDMGSIQILYQLHANSNSKIQIPIQKYQFQIKITECE